MWWHTCRNQILSFSETDQSISIGRWASVQSTTGSRGVRISGSNAGYTMFRGSVKSTGYPLHSPVSPSIPLPCVTVCHHISTGAYNCKWKVKVNNPITGLYRPSAFQKVEAPRFQDNLHMMVVRLSALRNGRLYSPGNIPGNHFC